MESKQRNPATYKTKFFILRIKNPMQRSNGRFTSFPINEISPQLQPFILLPCEIIQIFQINLPQTIPFQHSFPELNVQIYFH